MRRTAKVSDVPGGGDACTLDASPLPVLVTDGDGVVRVLNAAAASLLPQLAVGARLERGGPTWLAEAQSRRAERAEGPVGSRRFQAHRTRAADGSVAWWLADNTELHSARQALRTERERTAFLAEASHRLLSSPDADTCMETTARLAAGHLADAALVVGGPAGRHPQLTRVCGDGSLHRDKLRADPGELPGLAEALGGPPAVPAARPGEPVAVPEWVVPEEFGPVGDVLVVPLPGSAGPAGALVLLRRGGGERFGEDEAAFVRVFAARAGAALCSALLLARQSALADLLMRDLLPPELHDRTGVEIAGGYRASRDEERVGGDFYDVHPADDDGDGTGETLAVLGDVCGRGLEAAVLTGRIRNTLGALRMVEPDHEKLLKLLNGSLLSVHHTRYATLVLASITPHHGGVGLRLTSGGHPPPLIVRAGGEVEEVPTHGTLVGALPEVSATTHTTELQPGETCLLYSDGITEAKGGPQGSELFGEERLRRVLGRCAGMPAETVVERVQSDAAEWVGQGHHDDMAVMAITAPRRTHLSAVGGHGPGRFTR
ncbi:SpoIIE family protein phosphatase [Streptomyces sp. NPDC059740]|uniref:SpoIIE family protein phosphatase n=1 Tax=Streptomyces sp. NPDC059740 TaxID=3346926 RepID=UPI0036567B21